MIYTTSGESRNNGSTTGAFRVTHTHTPLAFFLLFLVKAERHPYMYVSNVMWALTVCIDFVRWEAGRILLWRLCLLSKTHTLSWFERGLDVIVIVILRTIGSWFGKHYFCVQSQANTIIIHCPFCRTTSKSNTIGKRTTPRSKFEYLRLNCKYN